MIPLVVKGFFFFFTHSIVRYVAAGHNISCLSVVGFIGVSFQTQHGHDLGIQDKKRVAGICSSWFTDVVRKGLWISQFGSFRSFLYAKFCGWLE